MNSYFVRFLGKIQQVRTVLLTPRFPEVEIKREALIKPMGSAYGRKYIACSHLSANPILVSGGVGEDISFDVELISNYNARAILFDPTPRAITHIADISRRYGLPNQSQYSETGRQEAPNYNLVSVNAGNLALHPYALLEEAKIVKFFEPPSSDHVSYSIQNIQNHFKTLGAHIEVEAIGPREVLELISPMEIEVLKLDIEGSEFAFLDSCFRKEIYPAQILVEIDELHFPSFRSRKIARKLFKLFYENNYSLVYRDGYNFTYLRK